MGYPQAKHFQSLNITMWTAAFSCMGVGLFGLKDWLSGHQWDLFPRAMYSAFGRVLWTLGLSWIVTACYYGYGGTRESIRSRMRLRETNLRHFSWSITVPESFAFMSDKHCDVLADMATFCATVLLWIPRAHNGNYRRVRNRSQRTTLLRTV